MNFLEGLYMANESGFKGNLFDEFLAQGYYRSQHFLFTTNETATAINGKPSPVFWLRLPIKNLVDNKAATAIKKKCAAFTITFKKAIITNEVDDLYNQYLTNINFDAAESCTSYLHDSFVQNPFDDYMVTIHDGKILIAVGFFDKGQNAIAGILNFYHPAYKKYSLGKYLMLQKINYCKQNSIGFYYTGYISTGINKFDYKLFPDAKAIEVYLPMHKKWSPYHLLGKQKLQDYYTLNIQNS